ncbi:DUF1244 domain-containing protein [Aliiglaciecola sp. LCG003]|uniref:DUF1244 domain-containing protein n=1 Tax=Aliiglaciecola sp. LCG003 TaxID=3053655 RepID=UPI0025732917|nr:DUF1244 domain-containing protein [Aliiglaciecola sp. LCG003]WJG07795.1 DUF1244 domain-containing protein [Aliiglaciecola sp. LCG003]
MDSNTQTEIEAATFRRLLKHLDDNKDVQNIDLMILADFCRNCLGKWYKAAADDKGVEIDFEEARARIYGMPYSQWKEKYQAKATPEQLAAYDARQAQKGGCS